jgi:hypothetical protein
LIKGLVVILRKNIGTFMQTEIDGESILMNVESGKFDALRGTALAIWREIDGTRDLSDIKALLGARYDAGSRPWEAEVDAFVAQLVAAGYVVADDRLGRS